jgi:hypothetical protein
MRRLDNVLPFRSGPSLAGNGGRRDGGRPDQLQRGVHRAPHSLGGLPALVAISSRGAKIADVAMPLGVDERELAAALWRVLEIVDSIAAQPRPMIDTVSRNHCVCSLQFHSSISSFDLQFRRDVVRRAGRGYGRNPTGVTIPPEVAGRGQGRG